MCVITGIFLFFAFSYFQLLTCWAELWCCNCGGTYMNVSSTTSACVTFCIYVSAQLKSVLMPEQKAILQPFHFQLIPCRLYPHGCAVFPKTAWFRGRTSENFVVLGLQKARERVILHQAENFLLCHDKARWTWLLQTLADDFCRVEI